MAEFYLSDITSLPDPLEQTALLEQISRERRERIKNIKQSRSRRQSLGAGLLLNKVLACHDLCAEDVYKDEGGKPMIKGLHFNLSHSGDMVICVTDEHPIGCDIEQIKKAPRLVQRFFCESEKQYLEQFTGEKYDREFYRLWTMKESYIKYTGEGLRLALNNFEIQMQDELRIVREGVVQNCTLKEYDVPGYCVAVCMRKKGEETL